MSTRKEFIPKSVRVAVWNRYIGNDKASGLCFAGCNTPIFQSNFECGHVISEKNGGQVHLDNLRPICGTCNKSMGTINMEKYMEKYGLHHASFNEPERKSDVWQNPVFYENEIHHNYPYYENVPYDYPYNEITSMMNYPYSQMSVDRLIHCEEESLNKITQISEDEISQYKLEKLKNLCKIFGLSSTGKKKILVDKLLKNCDLEKLSKAVYLLTLTIPELEKLTNTSNNGNKNDIIKELLYK